MPLKVAVQNGLGEFAETLRQNGYEVVNMEDNEGPVDAIVYSGVSSDWTGFDTVDYYGDSVTMGVNSPSGIMLVNAHGASPDQIVSIIGSRFGVSTEF